MKLVGLTTKSPAAQTLDSSDFRFWSRNGTPRRSRFGSRSPRKRTSCFWPMATSTMSQSMTNSDPLTGSGRRRSLLSGVPSSFLTNSRPTNFAVVVANHPGRRDHVHDLDAFDLGFFELELLDRDFLDGAAIGHYGTLRAHAQDGADAVHRGEAAADGDDALPTQTSLLPRLTSSRNWRPETTPSRSSPGPERLRNLAPRGDEHRVVVVDQVLELDVLADFSVVVDLDAEVE